MVGSHTSIYTPRRQSPITSHHPSLPTHLLRRRPEPQDVVEVGVDLEDARDVGGGRDRVHVLLEVDAGGEGCLWLFLYLCLVGWLVGWCCGWVGLGLGWWDGIHSYGCGAPWYRLKAHMYDV